MPHTLTLPQFTILILQAVKNGLIGKLDMIAGQIFALRLMYLHLTLTYFDFERRETTRGQQSI